VRTFSTVSSRADTARTRRRLLRPALAAASLRERAGWLARDTVDPLWISSWLRPGEGGADCAEPPPPASSPLRVPIPPAPAQVDRWALIVAVSCGYVWRGRGDRE